MLEIHVRGLKVQVKGNVNARKDIPYRILLHIQCYVMFQCLEKHHIWLRCSGVQILLAI